MECYFSFYSIGVKFFEENKRSVFKWGLTPNSIGETSNLSSVHFCG